MPHDPLNLIAEVLGEPAHEMRNPANADYRCPFLASTCTKTGHHVTSPLPVCSLYRRGRAGVEPRGEPVCVCPNRFLEAQIQTDVIRECWVGAPPANPTLVREIHMEKFGSVDFVVADLTEGGQGVKDFVSVELQAVDITGSYVPAFEALTHQQVLEERPTYGFNWANVRKRLLAQLRDKGFYHHHWGTRIASVMQEDLFEKICEHADIAQVPRAQSNIVFLLYQFVPHGGRWRMEFSRAVPTTHSALTMASLYERVPDRAAFEQRILAQNSS